MSLSNKKTHLKSTCVLFKYLNRIYTSYMRVVILFYFVIAYPFVIVHCVILIVYPVVFHLLIMLILIFKKHVFTICPTFLSIAGYL